MNPKKIRHISKTLSLVLRHQPEKFNLQLDAQGWCVVADLLEKFNKKGIALNQEVLEEVVRSNDKKRFAFSEDGLNIRASQGHSIDIDLAYQPVVPPEILYHGTAERNLASIFKEGLKKRNRHHVHLSADKETALNVGQRYGKPKLLIIRAREMHEQGHLFYCSENNVWLTEEVAPEFFSK